MTADYAKQKRALDSVEESTVAELLPSRSIASTSLFAIAVLLALYFGWLNRNEYFLAADSGLGYALGIVGGSMMLALLMYPLRKRFYHTSIFIFSTKNWFKLHMILGVLGPLLILYHCNFGLGSTNSNIALGSMLLMVASGLIGRFIYGKIHYGLYGKKIEFQELLSHRILTKQQLYEDRSREIVFISEDVSNRLRSYEQSILCPSGVFGTLFGVATLGLSTRISYFHFVRRIKLDQLNNSRYSQLSKRERAQHFSSVKKHIAAYLSAVRKIAGLKFYEQLFSLWHMLHLPIFFMLIVTGFVHVYAVHVY